MHILNAAFTCSRIHSNHGGICSGPRHSCPDQNTYQDSRSSNRVCEAGIIIESTGVFAWYSMHCVDDVCYTYCTDVFIGRAQYLPQIGDIVMSDVNHFLNGERN